MGFNPVARKRAPTDPATLTMPALRTQTIIRCLVAIAQHHGLSVDPIRLIQKHNLGAREPDAALLQRIASDIGLSASAGTLSWKDLLTQRDRFPLLARLTDGTGMIIVGARASSSGKVAVLDPVDQQPKVRWLGRQPFCRRWRGDVMFLQPQPADADPDPLIHAIELQRQGRLDEASHLFHQVLTVAPNHPAALYSLAVIAMDRADPGEALRLTETGVRAAPNFAPIWFAHATALRALGRGEEALASYDKALDIQPDYLEALTNSGVLLRELLRHGEALERFNRILSIDPNSTTALANCAILLTEFKQSEEAIKLFERLLALDSNFDYGLGLLCYERLHICDWTDYQPLVDKIIEGVRAGRRACKTLALMAICDSAEDHFRAAKIFAESYCPRQPISLWQGEQYHHDRIRIAYVSADLREHPVGHLMAGVFEHHDKSRFETIAISVGIDDQSRLRERMVKAFDHFIDASLMGSRQIAEKMREMEVDIAIDLSGYTSDSRIQVFAYRPAPVQVGYLGYPGTLGTDYMDYIIADRHVIPEEHQLFYSERVLYLPDSYLPTDDSIRISERTPTRAECGLPETGFVFCSFSHDYKITPAIFDVWMRLLAQVPDSVLWLMSRNELSQRNLRREAEQRGIDPSRLIFASRVPRVEDHLARYRQADLFLDTHPYNAHTTAADALMAGLPVVTYMGDAFPARVAGSLLQAIGMPELITDSLEKYEALALVLATHRERLANMKHRLLTNRTTQPLFDTKSLCRNIEALYLDVRHTAEDMQVPVREPVKTRALDLGCGSQPKNPFSADEVFGIDVREDLNSNIWRADLAIDPIPFPDNTFDYVSAYDFLEHIPRVIYTPTRRNAFVELMNEIYRVLKVGGTFLSFTPAYPQPAAFQDPTHVNIITELTFPAYFDHVNRWAEGYGFNGAFFIKKQEWQGMHLMTIMQKTNRPDAINKNIDIDKYLVLMPAQEKSVSDHIEIKSPAAMAALHEKHWSTFLDDARNRSLYESWWNTDRVNFWRHTRLLSPVLDVLSTMKKHSWLTVGDGSGTDAWMLLRAGFHSVLATDLDETVLAETQKRGYIKEFKVENAEALSFAADSFDFVLCKESLHHMSRPYAAIYEILRVAKYGVVVIEPQDPWIDWPCRTDLTQPHYESVGNYVYQFSARELEKIAYGMNIVGVATKTLVDVYIPDCEFALCNDANPIWIQTQKMVAESEMAVTQGKSKPNYILGILFKKSIHSEFFQTLAQQHVDWAFKSTNTNPYL